MKFREKKGKYYHYIQKIPYIVHNSEIGCSVQIVKNAGHA